MENNDIGIYKIENLITGKVYIGSSTQLNIRLKKYYHKNNKNGICKLIYNSILIYGIENHKIDIIKKFNNHITINQLWEYEDFYIVYYKDLLGEEFLLNHHCNNKKTWMSIDYLNNQKNKHLGKKFNPESLIKRNESNYIKIKQYNKQMEYITEFISIKHAGEFLGLKHTTHISACCKGKRNSAYGYIWKYSEE